MVVANPSTNRARRSITALKPLRQTSFYLVVYTQQPRVLKWAQTRMGTNLSFEVLKTPNPIAVYVAV